ncbi:protein madd-4-like isoform X1 [Haliotis cracherodii]|uniref:protein madd-4-like isoform X1 n=1 Tax=Haliotis cracherodii TaxID=6455 RepID=UPI0039EA1BFB
MTVTLVDVIIAAWMVCVASGDHWGKWSKWSACSRTCDGGATYQMRKCMRSYRSVQYDCTGKSIRYATCNNEPCAPGSLDFREQQCAAYNDESYGGKFYRWHPYTDRKNPCALYCVASGPRTLALLAPKVLDGTRCRDKALDMCINGTCMSVGCDHRLGSNKHFDLCGLCGGSNACLKTKGVFHWVEAGLSHCSASCGVGIVSSVFKCRDRNTHKNVKDYKCLHRNKPTGRMKQCFIRKCPPSWKIPPWSTCSHTCGGGFEFRDVRCMDMMTSGQLERVEDRFCPGPKPSTSKPCNTFICPKWYAGEWSPCSVTCGWGYQYREVVCRHEGDTFCNHSNRPLTRKNCTTNFPCFDSSDRHYVAEHDENGGVQESSLGELRQAKTKDRNPDAEFMVIHEDEVKDHDMSSPRFVVSSWGPCSSTCGPGTRRRYVRCQVYLVYLQDITDLADSECEDPKPPAEEPCMLEPCYDNYELRAVGLTTCSRSCLGGTQETMLQCINKENGSIVGQEYCERAAQVPITRRVCNDVPCPQRWRIGDFSMCSSTCGGGVMNRSVTCIQVVALGPEKVLRLPDIMCQQPVPERERGCNTQDCPADWVVGEWERCSVTCGAGIISRKVTCQRKSAEERTTLVNYMECRPSDRPHSEKPCNLSVCPEIRIKEQQLRFFQLNKMKKVRLLIGSNAAILPGTSVIAKCPVKGFNKRKLEWYRNGRRIRNGRRVNVSKKGNLRIRKGRPERDAGVYTCRANHAISNLTIVFSNVLDLLRQTVVREKYLLGYLSDGSQAVNSALYKDPFDRKQKALQIVVSEWTRCSARCNGGIRERNVSCEIITNDYFEEFPLKVCRGANLHVPPGKEECNVDPCVTWTSGNWSDCGIDSCVRESYAIHRRRVKCVRLDNSSAVEERYCNVTLKPLALSECPNIHCKSMWNVSEWSHCLAECGETGFQSRSLTCIWDFTGRPAGRSCERLKRPIVTQTCNARACSDSCNDESDYCSIVKLMRLCRFINFRQKCCASCKDEMTS